MIINYNYSQCAIIICTNAHTPILPWLGLGLGFVGVKMQIIYNHIAAGGRKVLGAKTLQVLCVLMLSMCRDYQ